MFRRRMLLTPEHQPKHLLTYQHRLQRSRVHALGDVSIFLYASPAKHQPLWGDDAGTFHGRLPQFNTRATYPSTGKDWCSSTTIRQSASILTSFMVREMVLIVVTLHVVEVWPVVRRPIVKVVVYQIIRNVTCDKYNTAMYWGRRFPLLPHKWFFPIASVV
jgi:hypothetical protein